tara:strand:+ start:7218 stop:9881 length:2664 start_codon:yes stop_codon:yes gene_type:complete
MIKDSLIFILFFILPVQLFASHNRGGEITYTHLGGLTYEFTITTCTDLGSSTGTDRPELYIDFDLGTAYAQRDTFPRASITTLLLNHQKNIYIGRHTFTSTGSHRITIEDPNRNAGILNVFPSGNSDDIVFALETYLIASPFQGSFAGNNSVQFDDCPCPELGCVNKPYCYNPMAYDPDGDSLSYELVAPLGLGATSLPIPNYYVYPDVIGGGDFTIDPVFGTICWNNPLQQGEYNFTIKISEWRNSFLVGSVLRDVQLTIQNNCQNDPPVIEPILDTCVIAGDFISVDVLGFDQNQDLLELSVSGLPLNLENDSANFSHVSLPGVANGIFQWQTNCFHISNSPYNIVAELEDNGQPVFSDYETFNVDVRPPQVTGLTVQPIGSSVVLNWDKSQCPNAIGYRIYRKENQLETNQYCCNNLGVNELDVILIDQKTSIDDTTSVDVYDLSLGVTYCYIVTAIYGYGILESCPSDTACTDLKKEVPVITNISVIKTGEISGVDSIVWSAPTELDTQQYSPPYSYKIFDDAQSLVAQLPYSQTIENLDTSFVYYGVNTIDTNRKYRIAIYYTHNNKDSLVGYSSEASSVHLNTISSDNQIELMWSENVPWINSNYLIFRADSIDGNFNFLDSVSFRHYTDTGLINNINYCYYVESYGSYIDSTIKSPLINNSQIVCEKPFDYTPPCPPKLSFEGDCDKEVNTLFWTNPNNTCSDDAVSYDLYFTPFLDSNFLKIEKFENIIDTTYTHTFTYNNKISSVAGCYYITATDSVLYSNESIPSDTMCFDNCPNFILPNIFTPNNDGKNDFFQALMPIKFINEIEITIFNRWGEPVYRSKDPYFTWNGNNIETNQPSPSGIYYFKCQVHTLRLSGIEQLELSGFLHLVRGTRTIKD